MLRSPAGPHAYVDRRISLFSSTCCLVCSAPGGVAETLPLLAKLFQCNAFNLRDDFATFGKFKIVPRHPRNMSKNPVSGSVGAEPYRNIDLMEAITLSGENPSLETVKNRAAARRSSGKTDIGGDNTGAPVLTNCTLHGRHE